MKAASKPKNEAQRLKALQDLNILDTLPESDFDQITFLASQICGTPIALISLIDQERQWFKSKFGLDANETTRDVAFCAHAILQDDVFVVPDSSKDQRFADNPLVTGPTNVQFYAGAPVLSPDGYPLGTVCVIDSKPRELSPDKISALKALSNQVTRLMELRTQIAMLKKAEENLLFKSKAAEAVIEGIVLQDASGAIIDHNPAALKVLGLSEDQLLGKTSMDPDWRAIREDGSDFPGHEHPAMVCLRTGQIQRDVVMGVRTSSEKIRWIRINSVPMFQKPGTLPSHAVTSFADISEQIFATNELSRKGTELRNVLDGIPHMIGLWTVDGTNIEANKAYSFYYGKTPEQIKGMHLRDLLGEELYELNQPQYAEVISGKKVTFERLVTFPNDLKRATQITYIPNFENNKVISFLVVVIDISELRELEHERQLLEIRLSETAKLSALGEMAAGIAHEVNNPLAIIVGKAGKITRGLLAQRKPENSEFIQDLKSIETTANRIASIIRALRSYSRNAEHDDFEKVTFKSILDSSLELCREKFANGDIDLRIDCDAKIEVLARPAQISQVILNFLSNAYDAVSELNEKWVELKLVQDADAIKFIVTDSGRGIPDDVVKKMMQPFFTTKEVGKGTGLGLSISQGIMASHSGSIIYDKSCANTRFILVFPLPNGAVKAA